MLCTTGHWRWRFCRSWGVLMCVLILLPPSRSAETGMAFSKPTSCHPEGACSSRPKGLKCCFRDASLRSAQHDMVGAWQVV